MFLRSDRLMVGVEMPNWGWAQTNRFDRTGAVSSITLDGKYSFTVPEVVSGAMFSTGGMGLMAEFVAPQIAQEVSAGDVYDKIGVGRVERGIDEVSIINATGMPCTPYAMDWSPQGDCAMHYVCKAPAQRGIGFTLRRELTVQGNVLINRATLVNEGERALALKEYNHNFINLDQRPVGPEYALELSYSLATAQPARGPVRHDGRKFSFPEVPTEAFFLSGDDIGDAKEYYWQATHAKDGLSMRETVSQKPCRTAVWGLAHVLSCEVFVDINLAPGEQKTWERSWTFSCK